MLGVEGATAVMVRLFVYSQEVWLQREINVKLAAGGLEPQIWNDVVERIPNT